MEASLRLLFEQCKDKKDLIIVEPGEESMPKTHCKHWTRNDI